MGWGNMKKKRGGGGGKPGQARKGGGPELSSDKKKMRKGKEKFPITRPKRREKASPNRSDIEEGLRLQTEKEKSPQQHKVMWRGGLFAH